MDQNTKTVNKILNLVNLIHNENMFFVDILKGLTTKDKDIKLLTEYIDTCNSMKDAIITGMYNDDINTLN